MRSCNGIFQPISRAPLSVCLGSNQRSGNRQILTCRRRTWTNHIPILTAFSDRLELHASSSHHAVSEGAVHACAALPDDIGVRSGSPTPCSVHVSTDRHSLWPSSLSLQLDLESIWKTLCKTQKTTLMVTWQVSGLVTTSFPTSTTQTC